MTTPTFTSATPRHSLPILFSGQAQKEFIVNEALARLDLLAHPYVIEERPDPPANPAAGDCYLIASNATGGWAGNDAALAGWDGSQWTIVPPSQGMLIREASQALWLVYSGGWQSIAAPVLPEGGSMVDTEARATIANILTALRDFGIFS